MTVGGQATENGERGPEYPGGGLFASHVWSAPKSGGGATGGAVPPQPATDSATPRTRRRMPYRPIGRSSQGGKEPS